MNFSDELKLEFERDGFVVVRDYLSSKEATEVNSQITRFIDEVLPTAPDSTAFYESKDNPESIMRLSDLGTLDSFFETFFQTERFSNLASFLLSDDVVPTGSQWFNKPARVGGITPPHQDGFYFMLEPNEAVTLWIALDDIDEQNGCIRYVRGSQKLGMRPHRPSAIVGFSQGILDYSDADRELEVAIHAKPGDLIAHHSMIIHRADANQSDRRRAGLGLVYFAAQAKKDEERAEQYRQELFARWHNEGKI